MPSRITPLDVSSFASDELLRKGEQIFENGLVKHRFQTNFGLQATCRDMANHRIEMIVDGEQLFGRCTCHEGSSPCDHQVAVLLAWLDEPETFFSYQTLRKAISSKGKTTLVDVLVNLTEVFPDIARFFVEIPGIDPQKVLREDVADIFDFPHTEKIDPSELVEPLKILFVRGKLLKNEHQWDLARIMMFDILIRVLSLIDLDQITHSFPENFVAEIADEYEEMALGDPNFEKIIHSLKNEVNEIIGIECAEQEGVFLDQLKEKLGMKVIY